MYKLVIKTKYNIINLLVEDLNAPEVKEILEQPYVIEFYVESVKDTLGDISEKETPSLKKILKEDKNENRRFKNF